MIGTWTFETLLVAGALAVGTAASLWGLAILTAVVVENATAGRIRVADRLGCPDHLHRWLLTALGATVAAGLVTPAARAEEQRVPPAPAIDGLPPPDRVPGQPPANLRAREPPSVSGWVTVRSGDSLWRISRRQLPPHAPAAAIAARTRSLYDLNHNLIGADPDLIHPGQRLQLPPEPDETYSEDS